MPDESQDQTPTQADDGAQFFKPSAGTAAFPTPESIPARRPKKIPVPGIGPEAADEAEKALAKAVTVLAESPELPVEPAKATVTGRTTNGVNWAGVFLLYSKGVSLEELADEFHIPRAKLLNKARAEEWDL